MENLKIMNKQERQSSGLPENKEFYETESTDGNRRGN